MYTTPEEMQKKRKRNKLMVNFVVIPLVAVLVGALVALIGASF